MSPAQAGLITKNAEIMNVAEIGYQGSETKHFACEVCRQWFSPRRASARFCSPRCRQRSHRRASRLPPDKIRSANGHSQRNVDKSDRGPSGSAEVVGKPPPPVAQTAAHQTALASNSSALSSTPHLVQDQRFPTMWRIAFPDGRLSNMVNLTRAKECPCACKKTQQSGRSLIGRAFHRIMGAAQPMSLSAGVSFFINLGAILNPSTLRSFGGRSPPASRIGSIVKH